MVKLAGSIRDWAFCMKDDHCIILGRWLVDWTGYLKGATSGDVGERSYSCESGGKPVWARCK